MRNGKDKGNGVSARAMGEVIPPLCPGAARTFALGLVLASLTGGLYFFSASYHYRPGVAVHAQAEHVRLTSTLAAPSAPGNTGG